MLSVVRTFLTDCKRQCDRAVRYVKERDSDKYRNYHKYKGFISRMKSKDFDGQGTPTVLFERGLKVTDTGLIIVFF